MRHKGDSGTTQCLWERVPKNAPIVEVLGDLDELQAHLGVCMMRALMDERPSVFLYDMLKIIMRDLSDLMGAGGWTQDYREASRNLIGLEELEALLNDYEAVKISGFVLPGGGILSTTLNLARTVARRAERHAVAAELPEVVLAYLNRLSTVLFQFSLIHRKESV